jgi:phage tail-like protein
MSTAGKILFPELRGSNVFTANKFLEHHGFKNIRYKYAEGKFERNIVMNQNIEPGDEVSTSIEVVMTLSAVNPIKHLPSIYQSTDDKSGGFLSRYLWIFHSLLNNVNITLDNIHQYFNPMESPAEFFPWLVSWFSDYHKYGIPEETLRVVIKNIVPLYRWRGTAAGIARLLELIVGVRPEILDGHGSTSEYILEHESDVENRIMQEETTNCFFTVHFPVGVYMFTQTQIQLINDIIKNEKPAHAVYYLTFAGDTSAPQRNFAIIGVDNII